MPGDSGCMRSSTYGSLSSTSSSEAVAPVMLARPPGHCADDRGHAGPRAAAAAAGAGAVLVVVARAEKAVPLAAPPLVVERLEDARALLDARLRQLHDQVRADAPGKDAVQEHPRAAHEHRVHAEERAVVQLLAQRRQPDNLEPKVQQLRRKAPQHLAQLLLDRPERVADHRRGEPADLQHRGDDGREEHVPARPTPAAPAQSGTRAWYWPGSWAPPTGSPARAGWPGAPPWRTQST